MAGATRAALGAGAGNPGGRRGPGDQRAPGPTLGRHARGRPASQKAAARAGQLRAFGGVGRAACRQAPELMRAPEDLGNQPGDAGRVRRGEPPHVSALPALHDYQNFPWSADRRGPRALRGCEALRGPGPPEAARFRAEREERRCCGEGMPANSTVYPWP